MFSSTSSIYVFSNYGTSFYLGFIRQEQVFTSPRIIIGTNSTSKVSFAVKSSNATLAVGETTFSSTYTVALPSSWFTMNSSYSERYKGLHISASAPIYVLSSFYKVVRESNTSGASVTHLALPEHNLGADTYEYIAVSSHIYLRNYWNVVLLIGNENNTSITVTSPAFVTFPLNPQDPDSGTFRLQAGNPYTLTLNRFQTLLFGKDGNFNKPVRNDMTGTRILSNKPLTVISGAECAYRVSFEYTCEPIAVQIPPLVTLGTRFLMAPVVGRTSGEVYKVVPAHLHQTDVHLTCTESKQMLETLSGLGAYVEFTTTSSDYCYLESSLPVLLVQLALTQQRKEQLGDTSMIFIPSMDQYSNQFFFRTPTGYPSDNDDLTHFLSVVVPSGSLPLSQIVYNGQPISFPWSAIRNSNGSVVGYSCGFSISAGVHSLQHTDLSKSILGIAYGYGAGQAYGYPTGITQRIGECVTAKF